MKKLLEKLENTKAYLNKKYDVVLEFKIQEELQMIEFKFYIAKYNDYKDISTFMNLPIQIIKNVSDDITLSELLYDEFKKELQNLQ